MDPMSLSDDYVKRKKQYTKKWRSNWDAILRKYNHPHEDDAVIDMVNMKIIHNKGFIQKLPSKHIGRTVFASNLRKRNNRLTKDAAPSKPKHESSDSAIDSMEPEESIVSKDMCQQSHHYPALDSLDFTHGDADETGYGCIRYQYDEKKDVQPVISGPKEILDSAIPGSDDEDNSSCGSEAVGENEESLSSDNDDCTPLDFDYNDIVEDEEPMKGLKDHTVSANKKRCNKWDSSNAEDEALNEEDHCEGIMRSRTDGITSVLEAKENFVRRLHRYFMMPEEETEVSENDTAATSYSKSGYAQTMEKEGNVFKLPSVFTSVPESLKCNEQGSRTLNKCAHNQADVTQSNLEFNDYSTILVSNNDDEYDTPSSDTDCDADDELQPVNSHNSSIDLNRTVGGGLKLPMQGAKHVVIGNVPSDPLSDVTKEDHHHCQLFNHSPYKYNSPSLKTKPSSPKTSQTSRTSDTPSPFLSCAKKIIPRTPRTPHTIRTLENQRSLLTRSPVHAQNLNCLPEFKPRTPKTPLTSRTHQTSTSPCTPRTSQTPRSLLRLKSEDMLAIFQSPLPLEITPTKSPGRRYQNTLSPTVLQSRFDGNLVTKFKGGEHSSSTQIHQNKMRSSPLAKALKKMQKQAEVEQEKTEVTSSRCSMSVIANETYIVSKADHTIDVAHERLEKTPTRYQVPNSVDTSNVHSQSMSSSISESSHVSGHHDTYEFHSSVNESTKGRVIDIEKVLNFDVNRTEKKQHSLNSLPVSNLNEDSQQLSQPARLYIDKSNVAHKSNTACNSTWKDNKRKLSEADCEYPQNTPISQTLKNAIQESGQREMPKETPNVRSCKRLKKESLVLVTSTPIKKGYHEHVKETASDALRNAHERSTIVVCNRSPRNDESHVSGPVTAKTSNYDKQKLQDMKSDRCIKKSVSKLSNKLGSGTSKITNHQETIEHQIMQNMSPNAHKRTPMQLKTQRALITSTPIKKGTNRDLDKTEPDVQVIDDMPGQSSQKCMVKKRHINSPITPKSRNSGWQRMNQDLNRKSNKLSDVNLKKCIRPFSAKVGSASPKVAGQSSASDTNSGKSSDTYSEKSALNSSMSSSFVLCEGPGKCTKMFCFSCT
ncbi:uncharacterized protein [Amphiura filiformis]|uniref:uncharacterized protein n=1 Tax=Amphiura filiformis TaxID=82378 RepID=UPI003B215CFE